KIHDVEDSPDQAEAEGDRDVHPTQQEAEDDLLAELAHELSSAVRTSVLTGAPGRCRILRLAVGHVRGEDGVVGTVLDLFDNHRLKRIDAAAVELDLTEECHHIQSGQGITYLGRVQRARVLNGLLE